MYVLQPPKSQNYGRVFWFEKAFTPGECARVIALFDFLKAQPATVSEMGNFKVKDAVRKSEVQWLHYSEEHRWLWDKLATFVLRVNQDKYNFQLHGMLEALQLTHYGVGGFYGWHEDNSEPVNTTRKLSLSLQLSDPETYTGGGLVVFPGERPPATQGTLTFFPSFVTHKVEPVKTGERYSLVAWVTGDPFR